MIIQRDQSKISIFQDFYILVNIFGMVFMIGGGNSPYYWEPGYMLLNIVIYKLSINPHIFFSVW